METTDTIIKFYDKKKLKTVQKNAKRLLHDPVLSNIGTIQNQLNELRKSHRHFIFSYLATKYGEFKARDLAQNAVIKSLVDNFEDLDKRSVEILNKEATSLKNTDILSKLKHSFYYKEKDPKTIKGEFLERLEDDLPDLLHFPAFHKNKRLKTA